ncbi:MAG: rhomboid family intramembrane serine protease [Cyclobacteriaceae bacterium]|nr:rhomboid family intramembrane serine protease [Cyclobacteriaceae bacterium]
MGIFTSPLIHGDFYHLISNSFPIALLGVSLWYFYREVALKVIAIIYFFSGFWVWIVARSAFHLGASGIVYGLIFFHLSVGLLRMDRKTLSISLLVIFLYGSSILSGLLPLSEGVSFETHITGAISGLISAVLFRKNYFFVLDNQKEKEIHREECSINELYNRSDTADSETNITVKYISNPSEKEK